MESFLLKIIKVFILCIALNCYSQGGCDANFNKFINVLTKGNATVTKYGSTLIKDNISKLTPKHIQAHRWLAEIAIFIDTKNYQTASGMFKDLSQFKAYLAKIKNFNELLIIQQGGRAGVDIPAMKRALQTAIKNDINSVFDVIWENDKLRKSMFGNMSKTKSKREFNRIVDVQSDKVFEVLKLTN